jgi:hypothetical protein
MKARSNVASSALNLRLYGTPLMSRGRFERS